MLKAVVPTRLNCLLMSNGTMPGDALFAHAHGWITDVLSTNGDDTAGRRALFIPFADADHDRYAADMAAAFDPLGIEVVSTHRIDTADPFGNCDMIVVGGGNSFRLLKTLQELDLIDKIREHVLNGMPYVGASAGAILAGPTIMTTNDMPIAHPRSLASLDLVPLQLNAHYIDADPSSRHMGETREVRIGEFHEEKRTPVLGIREGSALRIKHGTLLVLGDAGAKFFRPDQAPVDVSGDVTELLSQA